MTRRTPVGAVEIVIEGIPIEVSNQSIAFRIRLYDPDVSVIAGTEGFGFSDNHVSTVQGLAYVSGPLIFRTTVGFCP